jgi:hypothetical protein
MTLMPPLKQCSIQKKYYIEETDESGGQGPNHYDEKPFYDLATQNDLFTISNDDDPQETNNNNPSLLVTTHLCAMKQMVLNNGRIVCM